MRGGIRYSLRDRPPGIHEPYHLVNDSVNVGVVAGLITGDPDINASERLEIRPNVKSYDDDIMSGIAINPKYTWGPINSQNSAYRRELAPLMALCPSIGRYDDIFAGWVAQRVMGEHGYHVLYGPPVTHQDRNPHDLLTDLEQEIWGMRNTEAFCAFLESVPLKGMSIIEDMETIVGELSQVDEFDWPVQAQQFLDAWIDDVQRAIT